MQPNLTILCFRMQRLPVFSSLHNAKLVDYQLFALPFMKHGSSKRRVLIVDDNRDSAEILQMFLELHDYEIRVAFSGASGLEVAADFRPHVVCSDLNMPGVSGFDMASILRKSDHGRSTYLIAMTGMNTDENFHEAIQSGFDMCLMKPFEIQKLLVLLESKFSTIEK